MKVYLIVGHDGEWSDREIWNVVAYIDKAKAKAHVDKLNEWIGIYKALSFDEQQEIDSDLFSYSWERQRCTNQIEIDSLIPPCPFIQSLYVLDPRYGRYIYSGGRCWEYLIEEIDLVDCIFLVI